MVYKRTAPVVLNASSTTGQKYVLTTPTDEEITALGVPEEFGVYENSPQLRATRIRNDIENAVNVDILSQYNAYLSVINPPIQTRCISLAITALESIQNNLIATLIGDDLSTDDNFVFDVEYKIPANGTIAEQTYNIKFVYTISAYPGA